MNKFELCFLINHLKWSIYHLERAKAFDEESIIKEEEIEELKEKLLLYKIKLTDLKGNE